jgi:hypothetical protein
MKWARRTLGGGSSFWGTPRVGGGGGVGNLRTKKKGRLEDQIAEWDMENGITAQLQKKMATTGMNFSPLPQPKSNAGAKSSNKGQDTSLAIGPNFAEWLMNWPPQWTVPMTKLDKTKFASWEMASSQRVQRMLSAYCATGWKEELSATPPSSPPAVPWE